MARPMTGSPAFMALRTIPQRPPGPAAHRSGAVHSGDATHRPDIEGLRAVAVVLVVLFHAGIGGLPGGFVGVDVFFVLSGFLITGLLLRELDATGTISLAAFYARRARRLLPAAALVLLVTLVASILFLPPLLVPSVAADAAAAAAYVSNIGFALQATDYFAGGQAPSPILHYWSLGVEEQFYLFWPALLLLVAGRPAGRGWRVALSVVAVSIASFGLALWLTSANAPWAFFSLPTRAWELGLGAMLAVAGARLRLVPASAAAAAGWLGLAMIVLAAVVVDDSVPFPGLAALLPTVGAALVVVAGVRSTRYGPARLLGTAVPRFLGRISYSLYLWHWPVLVIPAVALEAPLPLWARAGLVVVAIVLATGTQWLIEDPVRRGRLVGTVPRRNLAMAGALTLTVALVAVSVGAISAAGLRGSAGAAAPAASAESLDTILNALASETPARGPATAGTPSAQPARGSSTPSSAAPSQAAASSGPSRATRAGPGPSPTAAPSTAPAAALRPQTPDGPVPANLQPSLADARRDYAAPYLDGCHTQMDGHGTTGTCLYGDLASKTTVVLFGDSHALAWFPAVQRVADRQGWRFLSLTMSTCSPADIHIYVRVWKRISTECDAWRDQTIDRLVSERPSIILVAGTRGFALADDSGTILTGDARTQAWEAGMQRTLSRLVPAADNVIVLGDVPVSRVDPPVCLSQHPNSVLACATQVADATDPTWLNEERRAADRAGAGFIDPSLWVCPSNPCPVVLGPFLVYRDPGHLTATFSQALGGRLGIAIARDVARTRAGSDPAP
jgi:peptidoglycan/LPS O-acetylase OafA/YrhL